MITSFAKYAEFATFFCSFTSIVRVVHAMVLPFESVVEAILVRYLALNASVSPFSVMTVVEALTPMVTVPTAIVAAALEWR